MTYAANEQSVENSANEVVESLDTWSCRLQDHRLIEISRDQNMLAD